MVVVLKLYWKGNTEEFFVMLVNSDSALGLISDLCYIFIPVYMLMNKVPRKNLRKINVLICILTPEIFYST